MSHFDVLIVGAGSAGCVLAARLSERDGLRVGLIEAGGPARDPEIAMPAKWPFIQGRDYDWRFATVPQAGTAGRVHAWPRGKILGGSSCLHAMAHVRGHADDFAPWAEATGSSRWSFEGLLPAFRRMECFSGGADAFHGGDGPLPVWLPDAEVNPLTRAYIRSGIELGVAPLPDHNGPELIGATPNSLTIADGCRVSVADAYLTPAIGRPGLEPIDGATVDRLIWSGTRASGVAYRRAGQALTATADRVILALGSIGTPLLLMRSGIGDPEVLAAAGIACRLARRDIGRNLHDHLLGAGNLYRSRRPVAPTRLQLSESLMYLDADDLTRSTGAPDVVLGCVVAPSVSERFTAPPLGEAYTLLFGVTHPTSRGELRVTGPDIEAPPMIDPAYMTTDHDRRMFRAALAHARAVGHGAALDDWRAEEILPGPKVLADADLDAFIAEAAITHHHPVGTCRMGRDAEAIVDADLKLVGLDNLHVVDASVIPSITSGPIHAAVLAIAETFAAEGLSGV